MSILQNISRRVQQSALAKKLSDKYPDVYKWLAQRLSIKKFTGLPLLILLAIFIINVSMFGELAEDLFNSSTILSIDEIASKLISAIRTQPMLKAFYLVTLLGNTEVVVAVTAVSCIMLFFKRKYYLLSGLLISVIGAGISTFIGKNFFQRVRPEVFNYYEVTSFSFPSGHSTLSFALYAYIAYLLIRYMRSGAKRTLIFSSGVIMVFLIGFSRLYLGVHFLSDVLGGWFLGSLWLLLAISFTEIIRQKNRILNK